MIFFGRLLSNSSKNLSILLFIVLYIFTTLGIKDPTTADHIKWGLISFAISVVFMFAGWIVGWTLIHCGGGDLDNE